MNFKLYKNYLEWCSILTYSVIMSIYAFSKPIQFDNRLSIATTVNELSGFRLMWAFYGYSTTFPIIIGIFQFTSVILLLFHKTRILGCIIGSIILFNIILQDIIYQVPLAALNVAVLLQIFLLIILFINKEKLLILINTIFKADNPITTTSTLVEKIKYLILSIITLVLIFLSLDAIFKLFI